MSNTKRETHYKNNENSFDQVLSDVKLEDVLSDVKLKDVLSDVTLEDVL